MILIDKAKKLIGEYGLATALWRVGDKFCFSYIRRGYHFFKRYGGLRSLPKAADRLYQKRFCIYDDDWQKLRPTQQELDRQRSTPIDAGLISVIIPVYNTDPDMLAELVDSLLAQTYPDWEACLYNDCSPKKETLAALEKQAARDSRIRVFHGEKNQGISGSSNGAVKEARGEWVALLDHDDLLTPDALYRIAEVIAAQQPDLIYSDEDKVTEDSSRHEEPHFKPDFCPDNLRSGNYVCHFMAIRKSLVEQVGGFRTICNGSQDHDITLRCSEKTDRIVHIPRVLYHWRTVGSSVSHSNLRKCIDAAKLAVGEHMERIGWPGTVTDDQGILRLHYDIKGDPTVSVIVLEHGRSAEPCREALKGSARKKAEWISVPAGTNRYAAMNAAAKQAKGDVLLFIDSSVLVRSEEFMTELLMYAQRDDVGAVTPLILDRRSCIAHAGFAVGMNGGAICREEGQYRDAGGWHVMLNKSHNVSAVSAACAMIRRDHFIPFDENYTGGLGAVDWSLRLQDMDLRHVYTPHAKALCNDRRLLLLGKKRDQADLSRYLAAFGTERHDPCYSDYFSRSVADGRLRRDLPPAI